MKPQNSNMLTLAIATVIGLGVATTVAQARGGLSSANFDTMDQDADGFVTLAEILAARDARFDAMDADGDDQVTRDEIRAYAKERRENRAAPDYDARAAAFFDRVDANKDGTITPAELSASMEARGTLRAAARERLRESRGNGQRRGGVFGALDTNDDGIIARAELSDERAKQYLALLDNDADGKLSRAEVEAGRGLFKRR